MSLAVFPDQRIQAVLAFALRLTDAFTGREPRWRVNINLNGSRIDVPRNQSGYYLFINLPFSNPDGSAAAFNLEVQSDFYVTQVQENILPKEMDRRNPVVALSLTPLPSYPFPVGSTLVRGMVQDQTGHPIVGAVVEIRSSQMQNSTTARGEFVLYFGQISPDDVEIVGGRRLMVVNNSTNLRIRASHPDFRSKTIVVQAEEGEESDVGGTIQLQPK